MKGKVKTLLFNDLVGYNTDMAVYPVTSVLGVFDENNTDLKTIIANLQKAIEKKADGSTSTSTNFVPVIISINSSTNPGTPSGGSYNSSTKTITPPSGGWVVGGTISNTTYLCVGVANSDTGVITWSAPFNSLYIKGNDGTTPTLKVGTTTTLASGSNATVSMTNSNNVYTLNFGIPKGEKGDTGSGGSTTTDEVVLCYAYTHADSLPDKPTGGTYNASDKSFTVLPSTWKTSSSGLEKPIYMSIGTAHSSDGSIEWQTPFLVFSNKEDIIVDVPQSNYATTFCYKQSNDTLLAAPTGGTYSFDEGKLTTPPDGWVIDKSDLSAPFYMSIGSVKRDENGNVTIKWSVPIYLTSKDSLSQGETPGTDNLVQAHVVIAYQNADTTPNTPAATEGSVDFTTDPYTVTAPTGWFVTADDTHKITDDTWCTIKAFYYKKDSDGNNAYAADNNTRVWSTPVKSSEAKVSLTKEELDLVVGKISVTANEIKTAVGNYVLDASYIETVAKKITTTTDIASLVAGQINIQALDYKLIADNITEVTGVKDTVIQNAAGQIVAEVKANTDGLLEAFAENIVLKASKAGNGKGSYIQLLAESASGQVAAQLSVGTNSEGASFISTVADKIDIKGVLQTQDIYVGGNKNSYFASDGSGYVANKHITWDTNGNAEIKGDLYATSFCPTVSRITFNTNSGTSLDLDLTVPKFFYEINNVTDKRVFVNITGHVFEGKETQEALFYIYNNSTTLNEVFLRIYPEYEINYNIPWYAMDKDNPSFYKLYEGVSAGTTIALYPQQLYLIKAKTYYASEESPNYTSLTILNGYLTGE